MSTRRGMVLGPLSTPHPRGALGWVETAWNLPIQMPLTTAAAGGLRAANIHAPPGRGDGAGRTAPAGAAATRDNSIDRQTGEEVLGLS